MQTPTMPLQPRFGATIKISYEYARDLSNAQLDQAKLLNDAKDALASRVAAIKDKNDPMTLLVHVRHDSFSAELTTSNIRPIPVNTRPNQTPLAFLTSVVSAAEKHAPNLLPPISWPSGNPFAN